jgi:hypothetical protein
MAKAGINPKAADPAKNVLRRMTLSLVIPDVPRFSCSLSPHLAQLFENHLWVINQALQLDPGITDGAKRVVGIGL